MKICRISFSPDLKDKVLPHLTSSGTLLPDMWCIKTQNLFPRLGGNPGARERDLRA